MENAAPVTPSGFRVRPLAEEDIESVVRLHRLALSYSLNSRLGADHLARLYACMRQDAACLVALAVSEAGPVGVVSATLNAGELKTRLLGRFPFGHKARLAARLFLSPALLGDWLSDWGLDRPVVFNGQGVAPCLTAIAVAASARRSGVGCALVDAVETFVRAHGHLAYQLDTRADNAAARAFYRQLGFVECERRGRNLILIKQLTREA